MKGQASISFLVGVLVVLVLLLVFLSVFPSSPAEIGKKATAKQSQIFTSVKDLQLERIVAKRNGVLLLFSNTKLATRKIERIRINGVDFFPSLTLSAGGKGTVTLPINLQPGFAELNITVWVEESGMEYAINYGKVKTEVFDESFNEVEFSTAESYVIEISNPNTFDLNDYPVKIELGNEFEGWDNLNCSEISFVEEGSALPYWIEECNETEKKLTAWVKVDLPGSSTKEIQLVLKKIREPSGDEVFTFFDDFSNGLAKWEMEGTASASNGVVTITNGRISHQLGFNLSDNYMFEAKVEWKTTSGSYSGIHTASSSYTGGGNSNGDATVLYMRDSPSGVTGVYAWIGNGSESRYNIVSHEYLFGTSDHVWYLLGIYAMPNGVKLYKDYSEVLSRTFAWAKPLNYIYIGYFSSGTADIKDIAVDWVRVRKKVANEPIVTVK